MNQFEIDLRIITPAFVRGREASAAELRAPSLKGQLRWWYRAWNPLAYDLNSAWAEGKVMGGTRRAEGQSPFTLRVRVDEDPRTISWSTIARGARRGSRQTPGGLRYLGFSFGMPTLTLES